MENYKANMLNDTPQNACLCFDKHTMLSVHTRYTENEDGRSHSAQPNTQQNDTDIVGQSIIQLSSEAFGDSFKSAWRRAAKQSSLAALCCFHRTNPSAQHELHPHPVCPLPRRLQREGGGRLVSPTASPSFSAWS